MTFGLASLVDGIAPLRIEPGMVTSGDGKTRPRLNAETMRTERDELNAVLEGVYATAPCTNDKAYRAAQKALKSAEELFFTDEELDKLLPKQLRIKGA